MEISATDPLDLQTLKHRYARGEWTPRDVMEAVLSRIEAYDDKAVWIHRLSREQIMEQVARATARQDAGEKLPLFGIPFAIKDNIDTAGLPTTAACPAYAYVPQVSATVVDKLWAAGAILIGKTNLDQFATGLVGTRSPYGACRNTFDPRYISGGSSSGSAVAVAAGLVSFSLGTDTAGSGRVPAAFNNIVGLKPTRGRVSTAGVVPACESLDCVSVFALTCDDAGVVAAAIGGYDPTDAYSRKPQEIPSAKPVSLKHLRFGVPDEKWLKFSGNAAAESQYRKAIQRLRDLGATQVVIDYEPFARTAQMLYEGPWLAERLAGVKDLIADCPEAFLEVTRTTIQSARRFDAVSAFEALHSLQSLRRDAETEWQKMDVLFLPTTPTIYTIEQVNADPIRLNTNLGYYTNFVNLLDLCGVAVPSGFGDDQLPTGVTFLAPAGQDDVMLNIADSFHRDQALLMGATRNPMALKEKHPLQNSPASGAVRLAVVGAHLAGQPLNGQLTDRKAQLVRSCRTSPHYRLVALPGTVPPKPGLVRTSSAGTAIEVEVWELTTEAFGSFVAAIPAPLGIGTVSLEDGESVKGFLCEEYATSGAKDISHFGGWRAFLASQ